MKRRELIILASLDLFNRYGEPNLTAVDIANELNISPGNLYYHFRGKEQIVAEIFRQFDAKKRLALDLESEDGDLFVAGWLHLYVFLELIFAYRFLFRNVEDLAERYPETGKKLVRVVDDIRCALNQWLTGLDAANKLKLDSARQVRLGCVVDNLVLILLYSGAFMVSTGQILVRASFVEDTSMQIFSLLSPYMSEAEIVQLMSVHTAYMASIEPGD